MPNCKRPLRRWGYPSICHKNKNENCQIMISKSSSLNYSSTQLSHNLGIQGKYFSSQANIFHCRQIFFTAGRPNWKRWDLEQAWRCSSTWAADSQSSSPMSLLTFHCHKFALLHLIVCLLFLDWTQSPDCCRQVLQCRLVCSTWRDFIDMEVLGHGKPLVTVEMCQVVERHPDTVRERLWRTGVEEHSILYCGGEVSQRLTILMKNNQWHDLEWGFSRWQQ